MVATTFIEPMGLQGDSALDIEIRPATELLDIANETGEEKFADAARKTFEFCMHMTRPEAGDYWECPLHAANLFAAGHAAIGYYEAYRKWGDEKYLDKAIYWIRTILPFTHLWEPQDVRTIYNTKPCFCSTGWFLSDWVARHVIWEILEVMAASAQLGIDWAQIDPELDWDRYHLGVTTAVLRWMIDHRNPEWMARSKFPPRLVADGTWDGAYADTYDPVNDTYTGGPIVPGLIARNILLLLEKGQIE